MIALYVNGRVNLDAGLLDIETAVLCLDGVDSALVVVELPSGKTITVGGGPSRVVAEVAENDTDRWCVVDPLRPEGKVELVLDGQLVDAPARLCVEKTSALKRSARLS